MSKYPSLKLEKVHVVYLLRILFAKPEINRPDIFAEPPVSHSTDCQPCCIWRDWFEIGFVWNPEDRFSYYEAHIIKGLDKLVFWA